MQKILDLKSMLIGAVFAAVTALTLAAAATQSSSSGRFQVAVAGDYIVKMDTATGQVWTTPLTKPSPQFMMHDWSGAGNRPR